jgi:hypothetical protein
MASLTESLAPPDNENEPQTGEGSISAGKRRPMEWLCASPSHQTPGGG